jgi:O6-methylguanine-DNA--protein-cysteine methyltransferase
LDDKEREAKLSLLKKAENWLQAYFSDPSNIPKYIPPVPVCFPSDSSTEFQRQVWTTLRERVLYGTITYAGLAAAINNSSKKWK